MARRSDRDSVQEFMKRRQEELEEEKEFLEGTMDQEEHVGEEEWDP